MDNNDFKSDTLTGKSESNHQKNNVYAYSKSICICIFIKRTLNHRLLLKKTNSGDPKEFECIMLSLTKHFKNVNQQFKNLLI